jgi:hypothetical protein
VYPEKNSLKDSLRGAGVAPADSVFEGQLRKDVQLSSQLSFRLNAPLDLRLPAGRAARLVSPGPVSTLTAP